MRPQPGASRTTGPVAIIIPLAEERGTILAHVTDKTAGVSGRGISARVAAFVIITSYIVTCFIEGLTVKDSPTRLVSMLVGTITEADIISREGRVALSHRYLDGCI